MKSRLKREKGKNRAQNRDKREKGDKIEIRMQSQKNK